jgi:vacuolar-type H+-ATPase subunit H
MVSEQSLLQAIRKKELEMNVQIEQARSDAAALIEDAKKEAEAIIGRCVGEGEEKGRFYFEKEIESINKDIADIRDWRREEELAIRKKWEKNVPRAVDTIIEHVGAGS